MGEMIKYGVKLAISLAVFTALFVAIGVLFSLIVSFILPSIAGEILRVAGNYLPLNSLFWGGLLVIIDGIIAFLIAKKIWELYTLYQVSVG